ncbi:MAG: hypothetical protein ACYS47_19005 [Planctomycetota bacterium]|jgi:hypothetical protein
MAKGSFYKAFRDAYIDLHVAYLALLRMRHARKDSLELVVKKDMENVDPFHMQSPAGPDAVKKWNAIWAGNDNIEPMARAMACVTETMARHWKSWSAFMDLCDPDLKKFKIDVPFDSYMLTATTISRGTLEKRARVLKEGWKRHVKGNR